MAGQGIALPPPGEYGVGMIFLPAKPPRLACEQELERAVKAEGQVPFRAGGCAGGPRHAHVAHRARKEPVIRQIFIDAWLDIVPDALESGSFYVIRKTASSAIQVLHPDAQPRVPRAQHELPHCHSRACCWPTRSAYYLTWARGRSRPSSGAPALLDQHLPRVAAGPPYRMVSPQRRSTRCGQLQLDGCAPVG